MELYNHVLKKNVNSLYSKDKDTLIKYEIFGFQNTSVGMVSIMEGFLANRNNNQSKHRVMGID